MVTLLLAAVIVGSLISRGLIFTGAAPPPPTLRESNMLKDINHERTTRGLRALKSDAKLVAEARHHSVWMLEHSYFQHDEPPKSFRALMHEIGPRQRYAQNIAWGTGSYGTAVYLVRTWMASHYHRLNILNPSLRRIGVGVVVGNFEGNKGASMATTTFSS